jgi:SAM-dependent methyltransferase
MTVNLWVNEEHAVAYLRERDTLPHRVDALEVLCELLPERVGRVLDLGTGDGVTLALVLAARPEASGVGLDFGEEMLRRAQDRFAVEPRVEIDRHDLDRPLPPTLGDFDVVVSSFAIHHRAPPRRHALYGECLKVATRWTVQNGARRLADGGVAPGNSLPPLAALPTTTTLEPVGRRNST